MSEISWIPGTVVLLVGVIGGLWMALRLKRPAPTAKEGPRVHDLELEIADLEARRDGLYAKLQEAGGDEEVDEGEVRALELAAARTLRDLDRAKSKLGEVAPKVARARAKKKAAPADAAPAPAAAFNPILAFATGVVLTGLVAALVIWAINDAQPDPMAAAQGASASGGMPEGHPEGFEGMTPEERASAEALQAELARDPDNFNARKQLMVLLAQSQKFVQAMTHAEKILAVDPEDPDALYVSSAVRLTMGQNEEALRLIDQVLARFPEHVMAHLVRGTALLRLGRRDEGRAAWEAALQAAGGSPDIEALIADEFGPGAAEGTAAAGSAAAPPPPADDGSPKEYRVAVEITPGTEVAPGAMLFVSVHQIGGGPPAAVKAVKDPQFPLELTLTQSDSNTGIPLPARGMIVARLDSDGHPGTESPNDLSAEGEGASGELTKFVLW